jgi:glutamate dehydrogenase
MLGVHQRLIQQLEASGRCDRGLEFLPTEEVIAERRTAGGGLVAPELAVLLAYAKIDVYDALLSGDLPDDPYTESELARYFPRVLSERFADRMGGHRLRRELIATYVTNSLVNRAGITFAFRLSEETGAPATDIARAYMVAREVYDLRALWTAVEALDGSIPAAVQLSLLLEGRKLVERATRWLVRSRPRPLDIAAEIEYFAPGTSLLGTTLPGLLLDADKEGLERTSAAYIESGVPEELAMRVAGLAAMFSALDIVEVASAGYPIEDVAAVYFGLGGRLQLHWLRDAITALPRDNRWQTLARAALRDELYTVHSALAREALQEGGPEAGPQARLEAWQARSMLGVERALQVLADIRAGGLASLETLSVALREVRNLLQSGVRVAPTVPAFPPGLEEPAPRPPESLRLG